MFIVKYVLGHEEPNQICKTSLFATIRLAQTQIHSL